MFNTLFIVLIFFGCAGKRSTLVCTTRPCLCSASLVPPSEAPGYSVCLYLCTPPIAAKSRGKRPPTHTFPLCRLLSSHAAYFASYNLFQEIWFSEDDDHVIQPAATSARGGASTAVSSRTLSSPSKSHGRHGHGGRTSGAAAAAVAQNEAASMAVSGSRESRGYRAGR